jgi:hypothetical protein
MRRSAGENPGSEGGHRRLARAPGVRCAP